MIVVSDTFCISNLLFINELDLLQKIYSKIFIPLAVYDEIIALEKNGKDLNYFKSREWIIVKKDFTKNVSLLPHKNIDAGEKAIESCNFHLCTPSFNRRKKESVLSKRIKKSIDQLVENNFWSSNKLCNTVLKLINEL